MQNENSNNPNSNGSTTTTARIVIAPEKHTDFNRLNACNQACLLCFPRRPIHNSYFKEPLTKVLHRK